MGEEVMSKKFTFSAKTLIGIIGVIWFATQLFFMYIKPVHPLLYSPIFLVFALCIIFINKPFPFSQKVPWLRVFDFVMIAAMLWVVYYYVCNIDRLTTRVAFTSEVLPEDIAAMAIVVVFLLEAVRRSLGRNLVIFTGIFVVYCFVGKYLPGFLKFSGFNFKKLAEIFTMTTEGIYGTPLSTTASTIFYFLFFGAFFSACGGGQVMIDLGMKASRGDASGPAKAAVISSGLMGMISGSAAANVSSTGVMTIPMMKRAGYTPEEAGAIESAASTGGQIMPPIMGVGAFIMAELLGKSYRSIALSAAIPAIMYYVSIFMLLTVLAKKKKHAKINQGDGSEESLVIETKPILPRLYLLLPAVYLIYSVLTGGSMRQAALYATALCIILNCLPFNKYRVPFKDMWEAFISGTKDCAGLALPTAACGIIIAVVTMSGLAGRLTNVIASVGNSNLLIALVITLCGVILLGMALPTAAAYLVAATLFIPVVVKLGVPVFHAHMFCFYYGAMAQITPPVCLASFTAAGIAGGDSWKTGWLGLRFALVAFIVPFVFIYQPAILLDGTIWETLYVALMLLIGVYGLSIAFGGFFKKNLQMYYRILVFVASILVIMPEVVTSIIGVALLAVLLGIVLLAERKNKLPRTPADATNA